jgi:hypothetical protein
LLISSEHIAGLLDKAIDDMQNGVGSRLMDLANVVASVAEAQNDSFLHVLPHAIGGFASELISARALVAIPMLPDTVRKRLGSQITVAVTEATSSLNSVKQELCSKDSMDHKAVMDAVGRLFEQATILAKEQRVVMPRRGRGASGPSEME